MKKRKKRKKQQKEKSNVLKYSEINIKNLHKIQTNINKISPHPKRVKIEAITKTLSQEAIQSAYKNKLWIIGENKVQETIQKTKQFKKPNKLKFHFIGHLQTNKTKKAVKTYDVIETVDREKLANKINSCAKKEDKKQKIFIQINISNNQKQSGINKEDALSLIKKTAKMKNIIICGLMAIGPNTTNKTTTNTQYKEIYKLHRKIKLKHKSIKELSIGMSGDYKLALKNGATIIRLGSILFGKKSE